MLICNFSIIRPPHETTQEETLLWLSLAHTEAEKKRGHLDLSTFQQTLFANLMRVGCKPEHIAKRGHIVADYLHHDWDKMEIYRFSDSPHCADLAVRSKLFETHVDQVFEEYYPDELSPPDDLIHVSCTGYVSPSGAQKIASKRQWGSKTTITHAYHMGCYASIPAVRIASGCLAWGKDKQRIDIVHTEICSLHTHPGNHNTDQLVSQSLFADGFIKYSVKKETNTPHLKILAVEEEIIPNSIHAMTWKVSQFGFQMVLAKEVPVLISRALPSFLKRLVDKSGIPNCMEKAIFAVHPGGPKILFYTQELLNLSNAQMKYSFEILKNYGNMSSATLPHIWQAILNDPQIPNHTPIISLAFGPGLSITGAVMEKSCGN